MLLIVQSLASVAMLLIVAGLIQRKRARDHIRFMMAAFVFDIVGLLIVELVPLFDSERIDPVQSLASGGLLKYFHALMAVVSLVVYVLQIRSGRKILNGDRSLLPKHRTMAGVFLISRALAYITMWMV